MTRKALVLLLLLCCGQRADASGQAVLNHRLLQASMQGDTARVRKWIAAGADVNIRDHDPSTGGLTPLTWAVFGGHAAVARILIQHGANVNARTPYGHTTPVFYAAARGDISLVRLLLRAGASVNVTAVQGVTPLRMAAKAKQHAMIRFLKRAGERH